MWLFWPSVYKIPILTYLLREYISLVEEWFIFNDTKISSTNWWEWINIIYSWIEDLKKSISEWAGYLFFVWVHQNWTLFMNSLVDHFNSIHIPAIEEQNIQVAKFLLSVENRKDYRNFWWLMEKFLKTFNMPNELNKFINATEVTYIQVSAKQYYSIINLWIMINSRQTFIWFGENPSFVLTFYFFLFNQLISKHKRISSFDSLSYWSILLPHDLSKALRDWLT